MGYSKKRLELPEAQVDTELDLAPLLSVMVKLIPVLLLSTAFVHITTIDSDLPAPVKAAIKSQSDLMRVEVRVSAQRQFDIEVQSSSQGSQRVTIGPTSSGEYDWLTLNRKLTEIKERSPETFTLFVKADEAVLYDDLIKLIDYSRKPLAKGKTFTYQVHEAGQSVIRETDFMFPDVQFAEALDVGS